MQGSSSAELYTRMATRRSVRRFGSRPVPRELIEALIEAAVTAPSASNKQPWRFLVVTDGATIARLGTAVRDALDRLAQHVEQASLAAYRAYGHSFTRFEGAPVLIVPLCRSLTLLSHIVDAELPAPQRAAIDSLERDSALVSTSLAIQNLLLMAAELGLGATVMTGPLVAVDEVREALCIRPSWRPVAVVPVGYPDEKPQPPGRKNPAKVTRWIDTPEGSPGHGE